MPRRSSSRPAMRPAPAPAPVRHAPPPALHQQQQMLRRPGIGSTIVDGMAFGGGSAVAHRAVDAVVGPRTITSEVVQTTQSAPETDQACANQAKAFQDCVSFNADDISKCQFYLDMLNECRKPTPQAPSWS